MSETPSCVSCGKTAEAAGGLIRGGGTPVYGEDERPRPSLPDVYICRECLAECAQTVANAPTRVPGLGLRCAFCCKAEDEVAVLASAGATKICDECVTTAMERGALR